MLAAILAAGAAGPAGAESGSSGPSHYLSLGGIWSEPDNNRGADYGIGYSIAYARRLGGRNWWELRAFNTVLETGAQTAVDAYQSGVGLDVLRSLGDENHDHFFVLAGGGWALNDVKPDTKDDSGAYFNAGVGWRINASEKWGVRPRLELRWTYDTFDSGQNDIALGLAFEIPPRTERVIEKRVEVQKIVEVPVEIEKIVEKEVGCVIPPPVEAAPDAGEADTDGDGVPDSSDKCPGTLKGARVDENGCVKEEQKISLPNIEFEPSRTVLAAGGKEKLEAVVEFLSKQADVQVDVFGHTDAQGSDAFNQTLSEGRARAVMTYLVSRGIDAGRLTSKGFGETQPIASNETAEGRAQNRRVELLLRMR